MCNKILCVVLPMVLALVAACSSNPELSYEPSGGGSGGPGGSGGGDGHEDEKELISIAYLKTFYNLNPRTFTEDVCIQGVVVANDWHSVFYKTLVVEDATGGIEVKVDHASLQGKYPLGTTLTIRCNGLAIGSYGGLLQLGWPSQDPQYETDYIPQEVSADYLVLNDVSEVPMIASAVTVPGLTASRLSTLVKLDGVQFVDEEIGLEFTENGLDTDRHLTDAAGNVLIVRTNAHSSFASYRLPDGSGSIEGILSYFNGKYQLRIINNLNIRMYGSRFTVITGQIQ